ncbi:hypothetical protein GCM10017744_004520 [Streptomyces antimycoticus]
MIRRHELSDAEWAFVQPLLPRSERGRRRLDDRTVLNGIVWKFRTGTAWRDVPERYGSWATLHTRFRRWAKDGTFERMLRAAQARADAAGDIEWLVSVDSTIVRAHQHAAGARKGGFAPGTRPVQRRPDQQDPPGLRRCGATARLHRHRREHQRLHPVHRRDEGDPGAPAGTGAAPGPPRPRHRRQGLQLQGHTHLAAATEHPAHHPERSDQIRNRLRRGSRGGRPPAFDKHVYKRRNVVERCFNRLKQWRGIATRYDKTAESYQAAITLASLLMWA